jgi:hypothetical protein
MHTAQMPEFSSFLPKGQEWFTVKEAAAVLGRTPQFVRDAFEQQKLLGFAFNGRGEKDAARRRSIQISRASILIYMMQAANFRSEDFADRVDELVSKLTREEKQHLVAALQKELNSVWGR